MMPFPPFTPTSTERTRRRRSPSSAGSINSFCGSSVSLAESTTSSRSESYSDAGGGWNFPEFSTTGVGVGGSGGLQTSVRILQECRLSLIHIPLHLYPHFVQAILSLILPCVSPSDTTASAAGAAPWDRRGYGGVAEEDYDTYGSDDEYERPLPSYQQHYHQYSIPTPPRCPAVKEFVNISVTPVECSIVCSTASVERFFLPIIRSLAVGVRGEVRVSEDEFVAIQVDGEGLDAGQRVLDLTSPLALAGV